MTVPSRSHEATGRTAASYCTQQCVTVCSASGVQVSLAPWLSGLFKGVTTQRTMSMRESTVESGLCVRSRYTVKEGQSVESLRECTSYKDAANDCDAGAHSDARRKTSSHQAIDVDTQLEHLSTCR